MKEFDNILNWKLLAGPHEFPGEDGGTCFNEAAIVAAGFEYRRVGGVGDLPPCFSQELGGYALTLNDLLKDDDRQKLIPFVHRMAGSADSPAIERLRKNVIINGLLGVLMEQMPPTTERERDRRLQYGGMPMNYDPFMDSTSNRGNVVAELAMLAQSCLRQGTNASYAAAALIQRVYQQMIPSKVADAMIDVLAVAFTIGKQAVDADYEEAARRLEEARERGLKEARKRAALTAAGAGAGGKSVEYMYVGGNFDPIAPSVSFGGCGGKATLSKASDAYTYVSVGGGVCGAGGGGGVSSGQDMQLGAAMHKKMLENLMTPMFYPPGGKALKKLPHWLAVDPV